MTEENSKPIVELFLKVPSPQYKSVPGLMDHQWFLTLTVLHLDELVQLHVTPFCWVSIPESYIRLNASRCLPVASINDSSVAEDDLELLLQKLGYPNLNPDLALADVRNAEKSFEDLYNHFMNYLQYDSIKPLLSDLAKLDGKLSNASPYLLGGHISYADCELMVRLYHVRVVGFHCKNFDIPLEHKHIWKYIENMHSLESFKATCPTIGDILLHVGEKCKLDVMNDGSSLDEPLLTIPPEARTPATS